jgi:L-alanine-DL-glutamate epimerase-like enolase superfamily enzyme
MKITRVRVRSCELKYAGEAYSFSQGRRYQNFQTTIVSIETDEGISGHGEVCPCGPAYMSAYAEGVLPALSILAPVLIGQDPTHLMRITKLMNSTLCGQAFAKTAIDLACWDILGKFAGLPVHVLLGGLLVDRIPLHRVVPLGSPDKTIDRINQFRTEGFRHFQVKLGNRLEQDVATIKAVSQNRLGGEVIVGDANGAWGRIEAKRISAALSDIDFIIEQPCREYDANLSVRRHIVHPVKLDESMASVGKVRRAIKDNALDAIAIKISRLGGLTTSRIVRDICADAGIGMTIEDAWGSGISTAAIAHLAASTPQESLLNATDLHNYNTVDIATGSPTVSNGSMMPSKEPGLGTTPIEEILGRDIAHFF